MSNRLTVNYENKPAYDIVLEADFNSLSKELALLGLKSRKFMIITDSTVGGYYLEKIKYSLLTIAKVVESYTFPAGEISKNLETVNQCYELLIKAGFDRSDVLIAVGGGVVGDLTGFVAATYLRGIRFIQVPTSLLSMVDSSIGGKTGVDYKAYKNMVGAFHQPSLVYMNLSTLLTLQDNEFHSGMGEIIKHGLIKDPVYYAWLKDHTNSILERDIDILQEMIYRSCQIKREVVERDPKEQGERALLNFGHTIGHAIEKLMNFTLLHGECVSIGMAAAAYLSMIRGTITGTEYQDILSTIQRFHQPVQTHGPDTETVYEVTKSDKKMDANQIRFILLQSVGHAVIDTTVTMEEMLKAIDTVLI